MFEFWQICDFLIQLFQKDQEHNPSPAARRRLAILLLIMALIMVGILVHLAWGILHHHPPPLVPVG